MGRKFDGEHLRLRQWATPCATNLTIALPASGSRGETRHSPLANPRMSVADREFSCTPDQANALLSQEKQAYAEKSLHVTKRYSTI